MEKQIDIFGNEHIIKGDENTNVSMQKKYGVLPQWRCEDCHYCFEIIKQGKLKHICIISKVKRGEDENVKPKDKACKKFFKR